MQTDQNNLTSMSKFKRYALTEIKDKPEQENDVIKKCESAQNVRSLIGSKKKHFPVISQEPKTSNQSPQALLALMHNEKPSIY